MEKLIEALGKCVVFFGAIFIAILLGTLMGTFVGWVVGLFYGDTILGILSQLGIHNITMAQFGTFMGFISGFLKTKTTVSTK
jgi:hypothetical protein